MFLRLPIGGVVLSLSLACGFAHACDALKPYAGPAAAAPTREQEVEQGRHAFEANCALCHGMDASGGRGPNLRRAHIARAPDEASLCDLIETGIPPEMPAGAFLLDHEVRALVAYVRSLGAAASTPVAGDAAHGAQVFAASGCSACHVVSGKGNGIGPELTDLGDRRSAAYVREVLLDPASRLPAEFLMVRAVTRSGEAVEGIRLNEDNFSVQLRDLGGNNRSFDKAQLKSLEQLRGKTPMPSFKSLSPTDLQDLVKYLLSAKDKP